MSSAEKRIVDFILHLPSGINPYGAVAEHMKGLMTPPRLATWTIVAQYCALAMFVIMFIQSVHLIYARVQVGAYKFWNFTRLGIIDIFLLDLANAGKRDLSGEIILFGSKYILVVGNAWFFLWVCACQCAALVCESGFGDTSAPGRRLHPVIRIAMNAALLAALFVPIPLVFYYYTKVNIEYDTMKSILQGLLQALRTKASTATPENYNRMELLAMLKPAQDMQPHASNMAAFTRKGILVYLVELSILSVVYVPLLAFSLGRLYARSLSQRKLSRAPGGEASEKISKMGSKIREQRRRLVTHALMLYLTMILHVPIIIVQLSYKGDRFLMDKGWLELTRVGLSLPFSIGGNGIAFVLNLHARHQLQAQNRLASTKKSNITGSNDKETFMPKFNPGFSGKGVELSILPTFIGLDRSDTGDTREAPFDTTEIQPNPIGVPLHVSRIPIKPTSRSGVQQSGVHFTKSYECQIEKSDMSIEGHTIKY
ncbi:hypothetical protein DFH28DRAFT_922779 [Melampsora americana]|nr:hypothetical protein DFH28DRAFT_922779 [Melampsora americana]